MPTFMTPHISTSRRLVQIVMAGCLAVLLAVAGCGSSGSNNAEENGENGGNGGGEPAATFTVTVADKTSDHPYSEQGFEQGYVVDGGQGREITLERGQTYEFQMSNVPSLHPFYITTNMVGQGQGEYTDGVENNGASGNETLTFTPSTSAPDTLYYNCTNHAYMGSIIRIE